MGRLTSPARKRRARTRLQCMRALVLLVLAACEGTLEGIPGEQDDAIDEVSLASVLGVFRDSPAFARVSGAMYPSAIDGSNVDVFVSANAFAQFGSIVPEHAQSGVIVPEGTFIIREVLDAQGAPLRLTLMVKGPVGYNDALGDWWFGIATADGSALEQSGHMTECYGCHLARAGDSYLFGVPADRR